ncbi:MAG: Gfo/Idh/MocA family oxidoreductase [Treponema sp.]|nr:Gfo/Idh/MocA family oxidoreductase [Treponema sp.]
MDKKLKVGIIGCGGIGRQKHLPALEGIKEAEVMAFCDIIPERAEILCKQYGGENAKVYTDYRELLKDNSIDVVHVCTPNRSHSPITVDALEAGKHVMCEKPMAASYEEAKKMTDAAKKTGKLLTIGYQYRCMPAPLYLKKMCEHGDLGEIYFAKAHALRRRGVPTWGVFLNEAEQGGGPLIDIGTHALDMTLWMMNNYKPKSVTGSIYKKLGDKPDCGNAFGPWDPKEFTVEDSAFGFITMENGATIILEASWALNTLDEGEGICTLCGTKAGADIKDGLRINSDALGKTVVTKPDLSAGGVQFFKGASSEPKDIECRNWYDAILHGAELRVKPEQAMVVTQILEAIYKSASAGKQINF